MTDEKIIESNLRRAICPDNDNKLFVFKTNFKFKKPKVYLNIGTSIKDFASIYQEDIYNYLLDVVPMVYIDRSLDIRVVIDKVKELF